MVAALAAVAINSLQHHSNVHNFLVSMLFEKLLVEKNQRQKK